MSVDASAEFSQVDSAAESLAHDEHHDEGLYADAVNPEQELWHLQRELTQAKLALESEIWDLRAEVQTLRLNALRTANELDKLVGRILNPPARSPYDPSC